MEAYDIVCEIFEGKILEGIVMVPSDLYIRTTSTKLFYESDFIKHNMI